MLVLRLSSYVYPTRNPCLPKNPFEDSIVNLKTPSVSSKSGDLPLAEALALFERSTKLAEDCNALLDGAELQVRQLMTPTRWQPDAQPFEGWQDG